MGGTSWNSSDWAKQSSTFKAKAQSQIFSSHMDPELDPLRISMRESCDSVGNPNPTPIIVGLDNTGSMGHYTELILKEGLGRLVEEMLVRLPVPDPQFMFMSIGDADNDEEAPLQVTQFESDNRIVNQLSKFYLEGMGGGNQSESYHLAWYFAAMRTRSDSFDKRGRKGYLFTIGDDGLRATMDAGTTKRYLGFSPEKDISTEEVLAMAQRQYHVFHVMLSSGSTYRNARIDNWARVMGVDRVLVLEDYTALVETLISAIQINEGADVSTVSDSWSGSTAVAVRNATSGMQKYSGGRGAERGKPVNL